MQRNGGFVHVHRQSPADENDGVAAAAVLLTDDAPINAAFLLKKGF